VFVEAIQAILAVKTNTDLCLAFAEKLALNPEY
jgi:hypothetical protein